MDDVTRALIAVGASAAVNCRPCIQYHLAGARTVNATSQDVALALEVGMQVAEGAGRKTREFVDELLSGPDGESPTEAVCEATGGAGEPACSLKTAE